MKPERLVWVLLGALACTASESAAHHSVLGFDGARSVTVRGVVGEVAWTNPHVYIAVDVPEESASRWLIEAESPIVLERLGWKRASIRTGDRISSVGAPARDGSRTMRCQFVATPDGTQLPCFPPRVQ
jgi:hypothetical protein